MKKFVVDAFRLWKEFEDEQTAREFFNEVKDNYTYCELKYTVEENGVYIAESLAIAHR